MTDLLAVLIAILIGAKLFGEIAERFGQPAVLGELLAGVLLGSSLLGWVDPNADIVHTFAQIGVVLLLFEIGLETDLHRLMRAGAAATVVACVGVIVPMALGYAVARWFGLANLPSVVVGAALTATSVGITARVLSDLGHLSSHEGQIILGAAVIDDVLGLIILAIVAKLVAGETVSPVGVLSTTAIAFGFLVAAVLIGNVVVPPLFRLIERVGKPDTIAVMAIVFGFVLAVVAESVGSAMIIGAFAAGLVLGRTPQRETISNGIVTLAIFFVPIFFVSVGAAVEVSAFADPDVLLLGSALIAVAVVGKFVAGFAPFWTHGRKTVIGVGMIPRGEVGLIFAQMGLSTGVLDARLYGALLMMVMVTTFAAPPLLRKLLPPRTDDLPSHLRGTSQLTSEA